MAVEQLPHTHALTKRRGLGPLADAILAQMAGEVAILTNERAVLSCGCAVYIGVRYDNQEPASVVVSCGTDHDGRMAAFQERWRESLDEPVARPAVEVASEMLDELVA